MTKFDDIPYIPTAKELADLIFSQLKNIKVERPRGAKYRRSDLSFYKTLYFRQFRQIFPDLDERLKNIVDGFPIIEDLHPFHRELIDALYGIEKLRRSLSRITNSRRSITAIKRDVSKKLGMSSSAGEAKRIRTEAIGRIGSAIDNLENDLQDLIEAKIQLSKVPDFNTRHKTIAFAGGPNAGKSSFVKLVSTGRPEIASYPFTTKELNSGHIKHGFEVIQLIDTPGLLDRPLNERNLIEMRSIIALKHLADFIVYLYDPAIHAVLPLDKQINLFNEIQERFEDIPSQAFINKKDIVSQERIEEIRAIIGDIEAIATIEENIPELKAIIEKVIKKIPDRRFKRTKEEKDETTEEDDFVGSKDKIEWIFFDEDDKD